MLGGLHAFLVSLTSRRREELQNRRRGERSACRDERRTYAEQKHRFDALNCSLVFA